MDPRDPNETNWRLTMFYFYTAVLTLMYWGKAISMVVGMFDAAAKAQNPPQAAKTFQEMIKPPPTPNLDWERLENEDPKYHAHILKWFAICFVFCLCAPFLAYWLVGQWGGYSLLSALAMFI